MLQVCGFDEAKRSFEQKTHWENDTMISEFHVHAHGAESDAASIWNAIQSIQVQDAMISWLHIMNLEQNQDFFFKQHDNHERMQILS